MRHENGFSLVEVLLVTLLIALAAGLAVAALRGNSPGAQLRSEAAEVAAQLRFARLRAMSSGVEQRFTLNPETRTWRGPDGRRGEFPPEMEVGYTGARGGHSARSEETIVFFPDGFSTGGVVRLSLRGAARDIRVSWLTGEVRTDATAVPR